MQSKKTKTLALRFTGNQHTPISTSVLTHTTTGTQAAVIKTLKHRAKEIPTTTQGTKKEKKHLKTALRTCGFSKTSRKLDPKKEEDRKKSRSISILYLTPRHKESNVVSAIQCKEECNIWGKLNSRSINVWHNTDVPPPLEKIQQDIYTQKKGDTPLKTAWCVYQREKIAGLKGVSRKPSTLS